MAAKAEGKPTSEVAQSNESDGKGGTKEQDIGEVDADRDAQLVVGTEREREVDGEYGEADEHERRRRANAAVEERPGCTHQCPNEHAATRDHDRPQVELRAP